MRKRILFCSTLFVIVFIIIVLSGRIPMELITRNTHEFNAAVQKNPGILNNQTISGKNLSSYKSDNSDQVILENMTIRNLTLKECEMRFAFFRNVTFEDCLFIRTNLYGSTFENVHFIGGKMYGYDEPINKRDNVPYKTVISGKLIGKIVFNGVVFGKNVGISFDNSTVILRNCISHAKPGENDWPLIWGSQVKLRMDNCSIRNKPTLNIGGKNNSAYITNCRFESSSLEMDGASVAWIENSLISGMLPKAKTLVVKDSEVGGAAIYNAGQRKSFFVNNSYYAKEYHALFGGTSLESLVIASGQKENGSGTAYIYGNSTVIPGAVDIDGGNIYIFDSVIKFMKSYKGNITTLNLSNVKILEGKIEKTKLEKGNWNNVELYPPIILEESHIGNIQGYNVEYPKGNPWKTGEVKIEYHHEPLEIEPRLCQPLKSWASLNSGQNMT